MKTILGIDIGTSSLKAMLLDLESGFSHVTSCEYGVDIPQPGWAEQDADVWWNAAVSVLNELKTAHASEFNSIAGIGLSGQMHGLVCVDRFGKPVRPAIVWLDQRSAGHVERLNQKNGAEKLESMLQNPVFTGSAFASLLWMRDDAPKELAQTETVLLPKDYIRYRLTGEIGTDYSDASGTACFSTKSRDWAWGLISECGLKASLFPACREAGDIAGTVSAKAARDTGLREGIPVIYGAGDQPCQSVGNGAIHEGILTCNIGTGGQIAAVLANERHDTMLRTQTFCHATPGVYTILGATLNAGMSLNWLSKKVLKADYQTLNAEAAAVRPASAGLLFLPYLSGERTPHMDPLAQGMFFGLALGHERGHFARAVMEGVAFSLKDALSIFEELGISADSVIASGGGAASGLWLQIQADILEKEMRVCSVKEQACLGACLLAAAGIGYYSDLREACKIHVTFRSETYRPNLENSAVYRRSYERYRRLYRQTKDIMRMD